jgi:protein-S-isoprenylcysteine O-methyltransferase Ste14
MPSLELKVPPVAVMLLVALMMWLVSLMQAHTTVNPTTPNSTSNLVDSGIYRFTRNPMYLGLLSMLLGWAVFLVSPLALTGTVVFVYVPK